ncbi:DUF1707 SHOCT-like domain-containing protein [Actinomycetes bacterium M1A6_2h]
MPISWPEMRARDRDRVHTCATLDRALENAQLDAGEHADRVRAATQAVTLGELHALIGDLQGRTDLTPLRKHRLAIIGAVTVASAVVAVGVGAWSVRSYQDGSTASEVYGRDGYLSVNAIDDILTGAPEFVGGTSAYSVTFFRDKVQFSVPDPTRTADVRQYTYRDGDWSDPTTVPRTDAELVGYDQFDPSILAGLVLGVPESVKVQPADQISLVLRDGDSGPEVFVRASNGSGQRGSMITDADGAAIDVDTAGSTGR